MKNSKIETIKGMGMIEEAKLFTEARKAGNSTKTASGLTAKQQHFAQLVANNSTLINAYKTAYNAENMSDQSCSTNANALMRNIKIQDSVNRYADKIEQSSKHDPETLRAMVLSNLIEMANDRAIHHAVRLKANELIGKTTGVKLFEQQQPTDQVIATKTAMALLQHRLHELLDKPIPLTITSVTDSGPDSVIPTEAEIADPEGHATQAPPDHDSDPL